MKNFSYRIYYEDTDAGGVVYYANYLKFYERARTDFLRNLGIDQNQLLTNDDLAFVVRNCQIDFLKPAKLDDIIDIVVRIEKISAVSLEILQQIKVNDILINQAKVKIVSVGYLNFKPKKIPQIIINKLKNNV